MTEPIPYNAFSQWLLNRYGTKVRKVALTSRLGCPNRDGTLSYEGCFFCDAHMAGFEEKEIADLSVGEQLVKQIDYMESRTKVPLKYLAYLQAGSNTHGSIHDLHSVYQQINSHPKVVSVAISTRPDCINEEYLDLIEALFEGYDVWIELGMQTSNERTLKAIGRNHTFSDTTRAFDLIKKRGFSICAHLILGLPGETEEDMLQSLEILNRFRIQGVKFHPLSITKGSKYGRKWPDIPFPILEEDQYINLIVIMLEHLNPDIVVQRLLGGGRPEVHLAPEWVMQSSRVIQRVRKKMSKEGLYQGRLFRV
jgi:hypothetical protein